MRRFPGVLAVLLAGATLGAACGGRGAATPTPPPAPQLQTGADPTAVGISPADLCLETVVIRDRKPAPATLTIKAPCRVMFTNRDAEPVRIGTSFFQLGPLGKDESWVQTFREPGTYQWTDANDPTITGTIVVQ